MQGYKQIYVKYANKLYRRPANKYFVDDLQSPWHKFDASRVSWFEEVGNLSLIKFVTLNSWPLLKSLHPNALNSF